MEFRNAVFIVTEEKRCPLYNIGEELRVHDGILSLPTAKSTCLILAGDLMGIVSQQVALEQFENGEVKKSKFECGGCFGNIHFEFKKEREFATIQMKLLAATLKREKIKPITGFVEALRKNEIFNSLSDYDLLDLAALLKLEKYDEGVHILRKGDPGTHFYIILSGRVEIIDEEDVILAEIGSGGVFGEVSLLSGDRVTSSVVAAEPCHIALLGKKDFQHVLKQFPVLQVFFYKLQARRISAINIQRAEELASGMVGYLSDMSSAELCQMLNSNRKSGHLIFDLYDYEGVIMFNEGEVIHAQLVGGKGKEAFYNILALKHGRFKFVQGLTEAEKEKKVIGGFMGMLMEGMKRLDDLAAGEMV